MWCEKFPWSFLWRHEQTGAVLLTLGAQYLEPGRTPVSLLPHSPLTTNSRVTDHVRVALVDIVRRTVMWRPVNRRLQLSMSGRNLKTNLAKAKQVVHVPIQFTYAIFAVATITEVAKLRPHVSPATLSITNPFRTHTSAPALCVSKSGGLPTPSSP